jgi:hypothetical protein
MWRTL